MKKYLTFLHLLFLLSMNATAQCYKREYPKGVFLFDPAFSDDPRVFIDNDTLIFESNAVNTISISFIQSADSLYQWYLYRENGSWDFWDFDLDAIEETKNAPFALVDTYDPTLIRASFLKRGVELKELLIYAAHSICKANCMFLMCGNCYHGIDFLFKLKAEELNKLDPSLSMHFERINKL